MSTTSLKWIDLKDFRGGIKERTGIKDSTVTGGAPSDNPALASVTNTYRCIGLQHGGLGPLPKRDITYNRTGLDATTRYVTGFKLLGPAYQAPGALGSITEDTVFNSPSICFYIGYVYVSGGNHRVKIEQWPVYRSSSTFTTIDDSIVGTGSPTRKNAVWMTTGRSSPFGTADAIAPGPPIMAWSYAHNSGAGGKTGIFPDPLNATSATPFADPVVGYRCLSHQNRLLVFHSSPYGQGPNEDSISNEDLEYTMPNDWTGGSVPFVTALYGTEDPSNVGVAASLSSSDLLIIRHTNGGYLVQGDVSNPIVRRLPGIMSTYGAECYGIGTPIGFVYGTGAGGVWAWQGADSSVNLSPDLDTGFWTTDESQQNINRFRGQFSLYRNWILTPNNWIYDIEQESWWRLEDTAIKQFYLYNVDPMSGRIYGSAALMSSASTDLIHSWTETSLADTYSWQSHPIATSIERLVTVKELVLTVQSLSGGGGTVTVTLTGYDGTSNQSSATSFTYSHNSGEVVVIRKQAAFTAQWVRVRIEVAATSGSDPAAVVHGLKVGYDEVVSLPRS